MHGVLASFLSGCPKLASTGDTNTNGDSFHSAHIVEWNRGRERTFSSTETQIFLGSPFRMLWWRRLQLESGDVLSNCLGARHLYVIWLTFWPGFCQSIAKSPMEIVFCRQFMAQLHNLNFFQHLDRKSENSQTFQNCNLVLLSFETSTPTFKRWCRFAASHWSLCQGDLVTTKAESWVATYAIL